MGCTPRQDPRPRLAGHGLQLRRRLCLQCHNRRRRRGSLAGRVFGRASHAGVAGERGISSTMILALALADVKAGGWFGKVVKGKRQGTSNVGPVTGGDGRPAGDATNVVTDYVHVRGESRSHDAKFFKEITKAYKTAFEKAVKRVKNSGGKSGRVKFKAETDYYPFRMKESLPVVKRAVAAVSAIGGTRPSAPRMAASTRTGWFATVFRP